MLKKVSLIALNILPILVMLGLIPLIANDYVLFFVYIAIIIISLFIRIEKNDLAALIFGILGMTASEYLFVSTGVETFNRNSLFGLMPIWLPVLWGYGFVAIKRSVEIINK